MAYLFTCVVLVMYDGMLYAPRSAGDPPSGGCAKEWVSRRDAEAGRENNQEGEVQRVPPLSFFSLCASASLREVMVSQIRGQTSPDPGTGCDVSLVPLSRMCFSRPRRAVSRTLFWMMGVHPSSSPAGPSACRAHA